MSSKCYQEKTDVAILKSDKVYFKIKKVIRDEDGDLMIKRTIKKT